MDYRQEQLEKQLSLFAGKLDNHLEDLFGKMYKLHPCRQKRGTGANPSFDGLFSTTIAFSLGYGSEFGRGYIVNIDIRTLEKVSSAVRAAIDKEAFDYLSEELPKCFHKRKLSVVRDNGVIKIIGDFSLN